MKFNLFGYTVEIAKGRLSPHINTCFNCNIRSVECTYWDNEDKYVCPSCKHKLMAKEHRKSYLDIQNRIQKSRPMDDSMLPDAFRDDV